jgi:hypothetical protein
MLVIMNEQHSLMSEQKVLLDAAYKDWDFFKIPADGYDLLELDNAIEELREKDVLFLSPVPLMIRELAKRPDKLTLLFHNDKRVKKELPNGRIISVVAQTGWEII